MCKCNSYCTKANSNKLNICLLRYISNYNPKYKIQAINLLQHN